MPGGISPMQRRRRNVLFVLAAVVVVTLLLAVVMSSMPFWGLFLISVIALGGYVFLLIRFKQQAVARYAPPKRVFATPIATEDESPKVGDNVILLRRSVG
jgi:Ca2+/Na+ antiporter